MLPPRLLTLALALAALSVAASAQVDLPKKRSRPRSTPAGPVVRPPAVPRGDVAPVDENEPSTLELPVAEAPEELPATEYEASPEGAASYVLDQLDLVRDPDAGLATGAVASLAALGPSGLAAARRALDQDHAVRVVVGARVLLRHGEPEDQRTVVRRMRERLPPGAAAPLLSELITRQPVLAAPELLTALLDHPDVAMRRAAYRALSQRLGPALLPLLTGPLASDRTSTRLLALDLVSAVDDPSVRHLLKSRLADPNARTAARAAGFLAGLADDQVPPMLLELAFSGPIDRRGAYAILSLVEREERRRTVLFRDEHVTALLAGLRSSEPIVAGASAAALAGVGFRSPRASDMSWLDRDVPHTLVRTSSGAVFHNDFTSLQRPALSRLALLTGVSFGQNGRAWRAWWSEHAEGFRARRAVLPRRPGDAPTIQLRYAADRWADEDWLLIGPAVEGHASAARVLYLSVAEAESLVAFLAAQGIFGAERLPGHLGSELGPGRELTVRIRGGEKRFELAQGVDAPWCDRVEREVLRIARQNRWQRWSVPGSHGSQRAFWESERGFWEGGATALERARRLKTLVLAVLDATPPGERDQGLAELARLYRGVGAPEAEDFRRFMLFLDEEPGFGARARALVELAFVAAATAGERPRPDGATIDPVGGRELVALLSGRYGEPARAEAERVLQAAGKAVAREAARQGTPFLRSVAAGALAENASEEDVTLLFILLRDPEEVVQAAAVRAAGEHRIEAARVELLVRAEDGPSAVRAEALLALARLRDEEVQSLCLVALAESDERLQVAAVEALAELGVPESATLLASLFARGPDAPVFEPARRGLERLGAAAWPQVLRLTRSSAYPTRRAAAFLLSEQGVPEAASVLLNLLTEQPQDARVAAELAVLSCVDLRREEDPFLAWWSWWDMVVHDDSLAWLRAAAERRGLAAPPSEALAEQGTRAGADFLLELARVGAPHVAERARRELARLLERPVAAHPIGSEERLFWEDELEGQIAERYGG